MCVWAWQQRPPWKFIMSLMGPLFLGESHAIYSFLWNYQRKPSFCLFFVHTLMLGVGISGPYGPFLGTIVIRPSCHRFWLSRARNGVIWPGQWHGRIAIDTLTHHAWFLENSLWCSKHREVRLNIYIYIKFYIGERMVVLLLSGEGKEKKEKLVMGKLVS